MVNKKRLEGEGLEQGQSRLPCDHTHGFLILLLMVSLLGAVGFAVWLLSGVK